MDIPVSNKHCFNEGLLNFLHASPTPYHAVATLRLALEKAGFQELFEEAPWPEQLLGKFFVVRNESSLIALNLQQPEAYYQQGLRIIGAHTDSPCLKIKPNPLIQQHGSAQLGVEVYGGALLHTWFDRDLSIAGRISYLDDQQQLKHHLLDLQHAVAVIPSLAIHLQREVNNTSSINAQQHLPAILLQTSPLKNDSSPTSDSDWLSLLREQLPATVQEILSYDLSLYDTQPPAITGWHQQFISSARLDNLISCYIGLMSLLNDSEQAAPAVLICHDHEEVGSQSDHGANGSFVSSIFKRIFKDEEQLQRSMALSLMMSVDNAHGLHPNYADRHDAQHKPVLNQGPVIKVNANQRYASSGYSQAVTQWLSKLVQVPLQNFVMRSDLACGSTIGPISAAQLGVKTVDVGIPQWAMHSIRETAGTEDAFALYQLLCAFLQVQSLPENRSG